MAELTGKVIAVLPLASGVSNRTGNEWASQEYVIEEVDVRYPQRVCFRIFGRDKIEQYNIFPDEIITVKLEFGCREHNGKWYNEINCWSVERPNAAQHVQQVQPMQQQVQQPYAPQPQQQYAPQQPQQGYAAPQQGCAPQPQGFVPPTVDQYGNPAPPQGGYQQVPSQQGSGLPF